MKSFDDLVTIVDQLLDQHGCLWSKKQTLLTLQSFLLEETYELLEAIDSQEAKLMKEELGDCLFVLVFISFLAEKNKFFALEEAIQGVSEKLTRRHAHVFGAMKGASLEEIRQNWEKVKKEEGKKNPMGGIPSSLPALARAQKIIHKMRLSAPASPSPSLLSEEEFALRLWKLVQEAESAGFDAESALRRLCLRQTT